MNDFELFYDLNNFHKIYIEYVSIVPFQLHMTSSTHVISQKKSK
jgi:hypothetical protein